MERFAVEVPGGELRAWRVGSGPPALILHGGPLSDYTEPLGELLAPALECVGYQQRGLPPSTLEPPLDVDAHVRDAIAVLDAAGLGTRLGDRPLLGRAPRAPPGGRAPGAAARAWSRSTASAARRRTGAGATSTATSSSASPPTIRPAPERAEELDRRAMAGEGTREEMDESLALVWPYYFHDPLAAPPMPHWEASVPLYAAVVASVHEHFGRGTLERGLPSFERPALFVHGVSDPLPPAAAEETAPLLPDAQVVLLERCGHIPWLEQPDALFSAISGFVAG